MGTDRYGKFKRCSTVGAQERSTVRKLSEPMPNRFQRLEAWEIEAQVHRNTIAKNKQLLRTNIPTRKIPTTALPPTSEKNACLFEKTSNEDSEDERAIVADLEHLRNCSPVSYSKLISFQASSERLDEMP